MDDDWAEPPHVGKLTVLEYALLSRAAARRVFAKAPALRRAWGLLNAVDADGAHVTLLGDAEWARARFRLARPMTLEAGDHDPGPGWSGKGTGTRDPAVQEWPLSAFNPEWIVRGWPDEWPNMPVVRVSPWTAEYRLAIEAATANDSVHVHGELPDPRSRQAAAAALGARKGSKRTCVRVVSTPVTSGGSPYARFQRALKTQNLSIIRAAAGELPNVSLLDALAICVVIRKRQPDAFERAAVRWLGRFASERPDVRLDAVVEATDAFTRLRASADAETAVHTLRGLCR